MEAKPFQIQSHTHACMRSHAHSLTRLGSKYIVKYKYKYYKYSKDKYNCKYFGQDSIEIQIQILSIVFKYNLNTLISLI